MNNKQFGAALFTYFYTLPLLVLLLVLFCGCGPESVDKRTYRADDIQWVVVGSAKVTVTKSGGLSAITPVSSNITYTEPEKGTFTITPSAIVATMTDDTLSLGSLIMDTIRINKDGLKICGVGEDTKCTIAAIRVYTTGSIEGFRNTTDGTYGVPVTVEGQTVLLTQANAIIVESYTIPANDRRLLNNDFSDLDYPVSVDFSNAGDGDYEMDLVIELVLGI